MRVDKIIIDDLIQEKPVKQIGNFDPDLCWLIENWKKIKNWNFYNGKILGFNSVKWECYSSEKGNSIEDIKKMRELVKKYSYPIGQGNLKK